MYATRVLIANDLRSYREAIASALRELRPDAEVFETEPAFLDRDLFHLRPDLVVCSRLTPRVRNHAPSWVELYPDCGRGSAASVLGHRMELDETQLSDLVSILDRCRPQEPTRASR